ncbi:hypothetical protein K402DRAFT_390310 [Aulographum hederae CBS 113979]|uniref:Increased recombination centers protein 6 n=1 Tax=Aulographum hederae CBS 113979 TaxID=1176131 RepID=A0A6G1HAD1_9PEZI|nr:hypothetical protein K402DRAFT_390310 [Aulographum hederae CBS 113979]
MIITHPRRLLVVGAKDAGTLSLINDLTGSAPEQIHDTTAGLIHEWDFHTQYYDARITIWIDEIGSLDSWKDAFKVESAKEVIEALASTIYCFKKPVTEADLNEIKATVKVWNEIIETAIGESWDGENFAVAMPQSTTPYLDRSFEDWEEMFRDFGFEYIDSEMKGTNVYREYTGIERLKESLEVVNWVSDAEADAIVDEDMEYGDPTLELFPALDPFAVEEAEMNNELRDALMDVEHEEWGGSVEHVDSFPPVHNTSNEATEVAINPATDQNPTGETDQVEDLQEMFSKLMAAKEHAANLPEAQRKIVAAKAVQEIMKSM